MESSGFLDSVKAEKMNAIARYNLFTNFIKLLHLLELFLLIAITSWTSSHIPIILKFLIEYVFAFPNYVMNQHVVFLVSNVIVFLCYILSRDHSSEYIVVPGVTSPVMFPENVSPPVMVEVKTIKQAVKQIKRFKRTQSEKIKSEITTKPRRELRRSVTEKRQSDDVEKVMSSKNEVERLSNEEFRIAIEAFISKQQSLIKQQSMEASQIRMEIEAKLM